ncbi:unnamed protein product [Mytilus coruscus]|uniref:Uncharacterized protein n=1 Tax=Mytilus coruscus TaxID=42192 RepID=A0A6J8DPL0_MYTCO|nr:unnamed protein product [Mytilus coruscus]
MGDPNQGNPQHQGSSIKTKPHWPGEAKAWDKNVSTKRGAPSYPMGHTSNYAGQGSAPCTQPAHTGGGQYETPRSRYGKWQDNRGADTRQAPAQMYGERRDNRGDDTRQTPACAYGDRQPQNPYNQGYTPVPPQGVTAGGSYGQQAYPMPHNENRPRENTRGPDSRGGARGTLGGISKLARWLEELSQYHMEVRHRAGSKHINADALSRMPVDSPCQDFKTDVNLATLPCGGCPYCARAQAQWSKFMTDVDDVVPLASKGKGVEGGSVNEILVAGQDSAEGGFLYEILVAGQDSAEGGFLGEILVADQNPADEGICISRVTVATVGRDVVIVPDNPDCSIQVVQDGLGVVLGKYSVEQICDAQSKDPEFKWLTEWLDDNSCHPAQGDLFRSSPPAKFYWTIKERFNRDERGMIYLCTVSGTMAGAWEFLHRKLKSGRTRTIYAPVGALEMSSDESAGGSPKRSWAAEEKREEKRERRCSRGRHRDRVPSVERDTPSLRDTKGQKGEAEVPGEAISGDHRDPSPKAGDTSLGWGSGAVSRSTRDGSPNSRERAQSGRRKEGDWGSKDTPTQQHNKGDRDVRTEDTPRKLYGEGDWGVKPKDTYTLRETGVSGQRTPQYDNTPRERDLPTLQKCPIQGCPVRALDIQPHVMLEHVAEVFGEPTGSPRTSLAPIRVAALQA